MIEQDAVAPKNTSSLSAVDSSFSYLIIGHKTIIRYVATLVLCHFPRDSGEPVIAKLEKNEFTLYEKVFPETGDIICENYHQRHTIRNYFFEVSVQATVSVLMMV